MYVVSSFDAIDAAGTFAQFPRATYGLVVPLSNCSVFHPRHSAFGAAAVVRLGDKLRMISNSRSPVALLHARRLLSRDTWQAVALQRTALQCTLPPGLHASISDSDVSVL